MKPVIGLDVSYLAQQASEKFIIFLDRNIPNRVYFEHEFHFYRSCRAQ
jgi:hypothetical protein